MSRRRTLAVALAALVALALVPSAGWAENDTPAPTTTETETASDDAASGDESEGKGKGKGKGKGDKPGKDRRPGRDKPGKNRFTLVGTVAAVDAAAGSVTVAVRAGRPRELRGTDATVTVAENAKVRRRGHATVADVQPGDRIVVRGRTGEDGALVAHRLNASPPRSEDDEDDDEDEQSASSDPAPEGTETPSPSDDGAANPPTA